MAEMNPGATTAAATSPWPEFARGIPQGLERGLRNFWYTIAHSEELPADRVIAVKCLDEDLVLFRDGAGKPHVLFDRCPHRYIRLSIGRVVEGDLQCPFHGLRFNGEGRCTLIPWEPTPGTLVDEVAVKAYPTQELGGYVWAYLGDVSRFPPPPLEDSVPEELLHPDRFVHFRCPPEKWDCNWMVSLDGGDGFHAPILHVQSQHHPAVLGYLDPAVAAKLQRGQAGDGTVVPLADRRVKIVATEQGPRGVPVDKQGNLLDHGHTYHKLRGQRFNLPCLVTVAIRPVAGTRPYVSRLFSVPIDYGHTRMFRYASWRAETQAERDELQEHFDKVVKIRQIHTSAEDRWVASAIHDLGESRDNEFLLRPDSEVVRYRRRLAAAFLAQQLDLRRTPEDEKTPSAEALVFPV